MMKKTWLSYPYIVWMAMFIVIPLFLIFYYALTIETEDGVRFTLEHFQRFMDPIYIAVLLRSIYLAIVSTAICFIIGYPLALILASKDFNRNRVLVLLIVIPMWMNFLLRTYAWMTLLENNGLINTFLSFLGLPTLQLQYNQGAVILGMVYNFLPFMVLPIYSVITKIDQSIIEAAEDLGANSFNVFKKIIFPLSLPGVISGITMVFMPAVTTFVISRLLGGGHFTLIGNLIEQQFVYTGDWNFGSAISIIMMILILLSMGIMSKYDKDREGGGLW
mgnify:FL=1